MIIPHNPQNENSSVINDEIDNFIFNKNIAITNINLLGAFIWLILLSFSAQIL